MVKCNNCKNKQALYGYQFKKPLKCGNCRTDNMKNVTHKRCLEDNCQKLPTCGIEWGKALYCSYHKKDGMDDVKNKRCLENNCQKQPTYGIELGKALYCSDHKKDGMDNVKNKRCLENNCQKQPTYGMELGKALYCSEHKKDRMDNVRSKRCIEDNCQKLPTYGIEWQKPLYCKIHKKEGLTNVISKRCLFDECDIIVTHSTYKGYCYFCFVHLFPNDPVARAYKTKEKNVADHVKHSNPDRKFVFDKTISNACSRRRPDIFLDCFTHVIIIEIDEHQHEDYESTCENKRKCEISRDVAHRPCVFIRFNPDMFINQYGMKVNSPWKRTPRGCALVKKWVPEWISRLKLLDSRFEYWLNNIPEKTITEEFLCFDRNSEIDQSNYFYPSV